MNNIITKTLLLILCLASISVSGQWTYKNINSEFDGTFKKAFTQTNNSGYLIMEEGDTIMKDSVEIKRPFLALRGSYFCDDYAIIDFVLIVNGSNKKYEFNVSKSSDSKLYYFDESIWTDEFIKDFKSASKCSIRVNQEYCSDDYYVFNFSGSAAAYNFITKKTN